MDDFIDSKWFLMKGKKNAKYNIFCIDLKLNNLILAVWIDQSS